MKTIKERAEKWGKDYPKLPLSEHPYTDNDIEAVASNSYQQGAKELQEIIINKIGKNLRGLLNYPSLNFADQENVDLLIVNLIATLNYE